MSSFSHSDIVGYSTHLASKHVKLPLKYHQAEVSSDWADKFRNNASCFGGFLDLSLQDGNFFSSLQYSVSNDLMTVQLSPVLNDEATSLGVSFENIVIHLPHPLIGKGTATFQFVAQNLSGEPYVLIDLIDVNYLLITLKIELSDFLVGNSNHRLSLDTFNDWVNISVPYSFELRSAPFLMKGLNPENLAVSMKDGGLLHFKRSSPLATIDIFNFSEAVPLVSFNFMNGLLRSSKVDSFNDGVSANAVVDIIQTGASEFAALSIDKHIKLWSLSSHKQVHSALPLDKSDSGSSVWLTSVPAKYFQIYEYGSKRILAVLHTIESSHSKSSNGSGYEFRSFDLSEEGHLFKSELPSFTPDIPLKVDSNSNPFKIQDFQFVSGDELSCFILWKSNTYSVLTRHKFSDLTGVATSVTHSVSNQEFPHLELSSHFDKEYLKELIFDSGYYDDEIVKTALNIFKDKSGVTVNFTSNSTLRHNFRQVIDATSQSAGISESSLWYKIALMCDEFRKLSQEATSILVTPDMVLVSQAHGVRVFREAHFFESYLEPTNNSGLSKLLNAVSTKISVNTHKRLARDFSRLSNVDVESVSKVASDHLSGKIADDEISAIMDELASIPDVVDEIKLLLGNDFSADFVVDDVSPFKSGEGFGLFAKLLSVDIFKSIKCAHERILHDLLILLLLCEMNDDILEFLKTLVRRLSRYEIIEEVFNISFEGSGAESSIETRGVSHIENSVYWVAVVKKSTGLMRLLSKKDYNMAFDFYCDYAVGTCYDEYILDVVLELINKNEGDLVLRKFISRLDSIAPINRFLTGLVHFLTNSPQKFFDIFVDYSTFEAVNNKETSVRLLKGISTNAKLKDFLSSIFSAESNDSVLKSKYYHALSKICSSQAQDADLKLSNESETQGQFLKKSLEFQKMAISILEQATYQDDSLTRLVTQYYHDLFNDALEVTEYEEAIASLDKLDNFLSRNEFRVCFTKLVRTLITHHEINRLFGQTNELFTRNYLLVDSILLELANEDLILSNALKCYEFLYSWRLFGGSQSSDVNHLGDKRGAVEALYIFITRFRMEQDNLGSVSDDIEDFKQFKLKVLELYMIILNCLKTFKNEDDQWLIKRDTSRGMGYVKLRELNLEYLQWLKELEMDLS
ncbi:Nucleoporin Nup120/160 family protein [Clavispora lusitaniae]|uniref:Nucleoporin Nup120/160 family protein n=1 Tax=Clavispora lusitaniae TaxID=36911 RepID=UPI00202C557B|nr:Nucleoporin Nup120/160 family protein [Clavispora lusitaniae]